MSECDGARYAGRHERNAPKSGTALNDHARHVLDDSLLLSYVDRVVGGLTVDG